MKEVRLRSLERHFVDVAKELLCQETFETILSEANERVQKGTAR